MDEKLMKERQRYEDFIAAAVTSRNEFDDEKISTLDSTRVRGYRNGNWFSTRRMREIKSVIDKM